MNAILIRLRRISGGLVERQGSEPTRKGGCKLAAKDKKGEKLPGK